MWGRILARCMLGISAVSLMLVLIVSSVGYAQANIPPRDVGGFIYSLIGEWIGTYEQYTDGKKADTKYFHAVIVQLTPVSYETVIEYYKLDPQTGAAVRVGESTMATRIAISGTATNTITGKGDVMIDPNTSKPEEHVLSETLSVSPSGGLQGSGSGVIKVSGLPLGMGKNGKVTDYRSAWAVENGALKISQQLKVKFKALIISKSFDVTATFTANRGSDIAGMMRTAGSRRG